MREGVEKVGYDRASEGQSEASGYYSVGSGESVKVWCQGVTLGFKSTEQVITSSMLEGWEEVDWI